MISLRKGYPFIAILLVLMTLLGLSVVGPAFGTNFNPVDDIKIQTSQKISSASVKNQDTPQIFSQIVTSIPDFSLIPNSSSLTDNQQITPEFAPFLAVTMVEVIIQQNFSKIIETEFAVTLNEITKTLTFTEGKMSGTMQLLFIIDEKSQLAFSSPLELTWSVSTELDPDRFWPIGVESIHEVSVQYLRIITSSLPLIPPAEGSFTPAVLLPNTIYSLQENSPFGFIPTEVTAYVVLPEGIDENYALNLTVNTNTIVNYEVVKSNYLVVAGELPQNTSEGNIILNIKKNLPETVVIIPITIRYAAQSLPSEGLVMSLDANWGFKTEESASLLSVSEYDIIFFILATLIPVALVSRLYIKRPSN